MTYCALSKICRDAGTMPGQYYRQRSTPGQPL